MLSVLMSVYWKESPDALDASLQSIVDQAMPADEIVMVKAPIGPELEAVLNEYREQLPLKIIDLPSWVYLGEALRIGLEHCHGDLVARMDTDDICLPGRFARQVEYLETHPEIDLVGGAIAEFVRDPAQPFGRRKPPGTHDEIARFALLRNPLNHMTVMFRRASVLHVGSYQNDACNEDYRLWVRMLLAGCRFHNLEETLVLARTGNGFLNRRGGLAKLRDEVRMQAYFHKIGFTAVGRHILNLMMRTPVILAPTRLRKLVYEGFLRTNVI